MNLWYVVGTYALAFALALFLLIRYSHTRWYWHTASVVCAFAIGLWPPVEGWSGPAFDLSVGFLVIFLLVWGLGAPFAHWWVEHHERHV